MSIVNQKGLSLIEVLVSMILIGIGLIGLANLQTTSLQRAHDAHFRSQASVLVNGLVERIKSNDGAIKSTAYVFADIVSIPAAGTDCYTVACTPAQLAGFDLAEWKGLLEASPLPEPDAQVSKINEYTYEVRVFWNEKRDGQVRLKQCTTADDQMACFQVTSLLCANQTVGSALCN